MRFTVHRPASAEVSPCCHRPSGGDVACGVDVRVARPRAAGDALENRLALAVFRRDMPTTRASLRRIRCGNQFQPPAGLVLQPGHHQSPPLAADLTVETPFLRDAGARAFTSSARGAGHRAHLQVLDQVLDADGVEAARHIGGGLLHPVTAAIRFAGAQLRDGQLCSCSPVRSALRPGQMPLQSAQSFGFAGTKAGCMQQLLVGQRNRDRYAAIHTHHAAVTGSRDSVGDGGKSYVPAPRPIQGDSVRLHTVGDGAGPAEPRRTDLRYPDLPIAAAQPFGVARFDSDLPETFMLAVLAPRRATVSAIDKVPHGLRELAQRLLLLHCLGPSCQPVIFGAGCSQLRALVVVTGRVATWLPVPLLLDGQIPDKPGMATVLGQRDHLLRAGKQPTPARMNNLGRTTDNPPKGGGRFLSRLKPRVFTPQI